MPGILEDTPPDPDLVGEPDRDLLILLLISIQYKFNGFVTLDRSRPAALPHFLLPRKWFRPCIGVLSLHPVDQHNHAIELIFFYFQPFIVFRASDELDLKSVVEVND